MCSGDYVLNGICRVKFPHHFLPSSSPPAPLARSTVLNLLQPGSPSQCSSTSSCLQSSAPSSASSPNTCSRQTSFSTLSASCSTAAQARLLALARHPARSSTEAPQAHHGRTLPRLLHCPDLWSVVSSRRRRPDFVMLSFACVSMLIGDEVLTTPAVDAGMDSGYHLLVVKDYSRAVRETPNGKEISSGDFMVGGHKWCICYCPNGADFISLFFAHCCDDDDIEEPVEVKVEFSFVDQVEYQKPMHIRASKTYSFSSKSPSRGFPKFVRRDILERSGNLKGDCFTIRCDIMGCKDLNSQYAGGTVLDIHQHFDNLLQNKVGIDVTFEVSGETFAAQRCVLAARSTVFMAQLFGHMSEGTTSSAIQIKDMRAKVFAALLRFIYTDSFPEIAKKNYLDGGKAEVVKQGQEEEVDYAMWVQDLFVAADRYDLQRLKLLCDELLSEHVGVSSVASTLALAEQHYCCGLKKACLKFIQVHSPKCLDKIMATDGWEHITTTYPSVLNELIAKLASNQKDKKRKHERM